MKIKVQQIISLGLSISAAYLVFSILYGWSGGGLAFFKPGLFLFESFHAAALYVPALLAVLAKSLLSEPFPRKTFLRWNLYILPFLSIALLLKILSAGEASPAEYYFISAFGMGTSLTLLGLMSLVSSLLIVKISNYFFPEDASLFPSLGDWIQDILPENDRSEDDTVQDSLSGVPEKKEIRDLSQKNEEETIKKILQGSQESSPFSVPSFPEKPEVMEDSLGENDDELHHLIGKVLRGETALQQDYPKRHIEEDELISPVKQKVRKEERKILNSAENITQKVVLEERPIDEKALDYDTARDEPEFVPVDISLNGSIPAEALEEDFPQNETLPQDESFPSAVQKSEEEERLDSLLSTLNSALEEDLPQSISDKLSPEMDNEIESAVFSEEVTPPSRKRRKSQPYDVPVKGVLMEYPASDYSDVDDITNNQARILEETLNEFKIDAQVTGISRGPVITMFELLPAPGVKLSRIVALQDNIALRLAASRVRIVAPIPGKHAVGIEIPNKKRSLVGFSQLVESKQMKDKKQEIPIVLGKDISGGNQVVDLTRTPHLLIAGSTGSGKSVCVNSLICSILYRRAPQDVKMILVDPKIVELKLYNDIPHLLTPVITEPKKAFQAVQWALYEMERRYSLLDGMGVRDIKTYNKRIKEREIATEKLPYIVLVIDEFADLMATSGKELEGIVARLAAMSRAVGIHLVLATQRPSTDVITGLIKANFPSRIAFMVASMTDSRIIIDTAGAEKLLGRGDMLFTSSWDPFPTRVQGSFLSEEEVERVVTHVKTLGEPDYIDDEIFVDEGDDEDDFSLKGDLGDDPLFDKALEIVVNSGKASASYLQRRLKIGYNRAARLVEDMEERGIVGPANGSKPRDLLHVPDRFTSAPAETPSSV